MLHGTLHLVAPGERALSRVFVMGPQDAPVSSWAEGDLVALSVGIYPDAWARLGGDAVARPVLERALERFSAQADPDSAWNAFCRTLDADWAACRPANWHKAQGISDWAKAVATRAALSGSGRSLRSLERRTKRLSGHTRRSLAFFGAFENLHRIAAQNGGAALAEVALEAGYADQSHMGRAVRRATGFSPAQLNKAIHDQEAFWCYRLLGERF